ncbi:hypothetical protein ABH922_003563 [Rhodococcus sp. 27YEA15]|uniref:hypothetical protein n=1 Tax=Rhodococcus sp. 27YEA15 TaxID=3156259 RepID=UPI003C79A059
MNRTIELAELLDLALRGRIATVAELAAVTGRSAVETERDVSQLEYLGFVSVADGTISYRRPDATIADVTQRILTGLTRDLDDGIAKTHGILKTLPTLLQAWQHGDTDVHGLPVDVMHGPLAAADMYQSQACRSTPRASYTCVPDTTPLNTVLGETGPGSIWDENSGTDHDIRLIVGTAAANTELGRTGLGCEVNAGSQVRMHPNPPSFFWILDHGSIGIPFEWGQARPGSIMSVRSPELAAVMTWIFHRIWEESVPVVAHDRRWEHPWDPILKLMNTGQTMESASLALGLTSRTGRRRVSDAMRHYGVSSQFSLGAAWNAARGPSGG